MYASAEQLTIQSPENYDERTRHHNDTITWLAETLPGSMRTSFDYHFDGQELRAEDGGAMGEVFESSITTARQIVELNPNLLFELRRRVIEQDEYQDMLAMAKGELPNTMVVISDFPEELMSSKEDVGGYNSDRKQTMLRVISRQANGDIRMVTQSLDGSDRGALEAIYIKLGEPVKPGELLGQRIKLELHEAWQGELINNLQNTYDQSLTDRFGGIWHAGIKQISENKSVNTAEFVKQQVDLINWFVDKKLEDSVSAEKRRYSLAATMMERFQNSFKPESIAMAKMVEYQSSTYQHINFEINNATQLALRKGKTFSGCGMTIGLENDVASQLQEAGYGNKSNEGQDEDCEYISKQCPLCGEKNVKTTVSKTHIKGSCGCSLKK